MSEFRIEIRCKFHPNSVLTIKAVKTAEEEYVLDFQFKFECGCPVYLNEVLDTINEYLDGA